MLDLATPALKPAKLGRNITWGIVFLFVLALLGLLGYSLINQGGSGTAKQPFSQSPAFTLKLFDDYGWEGKPEISPALVKGRPFIINFWASWCILCRDEAPILKKLSEEYAPKGVVFLGIAYQDRHQPNSLAKTLDPTERNTTLRFFLPAGATGITPASAINLDDIVETSDGIEVKTPVLLGETSLFLAIS